MEKVVTSIPFYVEQASYCIQFHDKNLCTRCTDKGCPALDSAATLLADFREQRANRHRVNRPA